LDNPSGVGPSGREPNGDDKRLAELRDLLVGPERQNWERLRERLENPEKRTEDVGSVLAAAVEKSPEVELRRALQPLMEEALTVSVRTHPKMLADALFPIIGAAIRKSIATELDAMLESLSQTLEQKFSARSLQWRWEAFRTRKPYMEVVLLRSLLYKVEQVFLIHRKTGIELQHVADPGADAKDPEIVAGMLTALEDFVRDTVSGTDGGNLETFRVGEVGIVLAYGPDLILSGIARGATPRVLNRKFQATIDAIEQEKAQELRSFSGEKSDFDSCRPQLEACLLGQGDPKEAAGISPMARMLLFGIPALLVLALVGWGIYSYRTERRWSDFEQRMSQEPGIVLTTTESRGGVRQVYGFWDPLAKKPADLLASSGLDAQKVALHFKDFHSLEPQFADQRRFADLKDQVQKRAFRFKTGSSEIPPEQRFLLEDVASQVLALIQSGNALRKTVHIEVRGNHDPLGAEQVNSTLARERAMAVRNAFISMGVPSARVTAISEDQAKETCSAVKEEERLLCRSASFRVID
jgi:outer membrane protein OmpA-like peptidoglycan-associated protein